MGRVTNGVVKYGRTTKPADYEAKRADCELAFMVDETDDELEVIKRVETMAIGRVHEMLGLAAPAPAAAAAARTRRTTAAGAAEVTTAAAAPKNDKEALAAAATGTKPAEAAKPTTKQPPKPPAADPSAIDMGGEPTAAPAAAPAAKPAADPAAVSVEDDLMSPAPAAITDAMLMDAVTKTNGRIQNATAIRGLIGNYVQPPKTVRDIPAELRQKFLDELAALKPVA